MIGFGSLNHSSSKIVLNNYLKTIYLRFRKVVVQLSVLQSCSRLIKFRVNNRCGNGNGSFEVNIGGGYSEVHEYDNNKT